MVHPDQPSRHLDWPGCYNARDLGGLHLVAGGTTRFRSMVRSDCLDHLTTAGWEAVHAYGVRTIVDLRGAEERAELAGVPSGVEVLQVELEDMADQAFWDVWRDDCCNPLYFGAFLHRFPHRVANVMRAIGESRTGVVAVQCGVGRDRTGLISLVLLALAGVDPDEIAADYETSAARLGRLFQERAVTDHGASAPERLRQAGTTAREQIIETVRTFDAASYLLDAGMTPRELSLLRARLINE